MSRTLRNFARSLRHNQTEAEKRLWKYLRSRELEGYKFCRQHPIGPYIVDFCCLNRKVIIEIDGGQHVMRKGADQKRTIFLEKKGFSVIRFWDNEVLQNTNEILGLILQRLSSSPSPRPSPLKGEG